MKVVDLKARIEAAKPAEQYCFECACGGQRFVLRPDAKVQCCDCTAIQPTLIWGQFFDSAMVRMEHPP